MKERPIMFKAEMVRAILDGRKTITRRIVKPFPPADTESWRTDGHGHWMPYTKLGTTCGLGIPGELFKGHGAPGDRLWVKETWRAYDALTIETKERNGITYRADGAAEGPWKSAMFMPRWASRITLEITDVRVERLQDITPEDCMDEGYDESHPSCVQWFENLWDTINGDDAAKCWAASPWVWVIAFKLVDNEARTE